MANNLKINVSGGKTSFGAVSQGDAANVVGTVTITQEEAEQHFRSAEEEVRRLATEFHKTDSDVKAVLAQMAELREQALKDPKSTENGKGILKTVRDNFSWAYPPIKDFVKAVWPVVFAAIGG